MKAGRERRVIEDREDRKEGNKGNKIDEDGRKEEGK